ncbi:aurora kinase A and ninein-interacting protein-like [Varanus komodoensis]|uniref:aurora kinase A and ninein-interacting protein-like n=1 Tax=Varanus komodoensis TaxID=61221 RepID=UPI001CF79DC6|nr:aurora kinase A and ninein-interacting protein-like [Varanus komodoensis]
MAGKSTSKRTEVLQFPACSSRQSWQGCFFASLHRSKVAESHHCLNARGKCLMKGKGRSSAVKQQETCNVWLDTSALKKSKLQNLIGKPVLRAVNRPSPCLEPTKAPVPFTKQTTISTFFSAQQAEERRTNADKKLSGPSSNSVSNLRDSELSKGAGVPLRAALLQPLELQEPAETPQGFNIPPSSSATPPQRAGCIFPSSKVNVSAAELLSSGSTQHLGEKGVLDPAAADAPLREGNGVWKRESLFSQSSHNLPRVSARQRTKVQRKYRCPSSCSDFSDSENINPQQEKSVIKVKTLKSVDRTASDLCLKTSNATSDFGKGHETTQVDTPRLLFTQDTEGHKVISNHFPHGQGKLSLHNRPPWNKSSTVSSPSCKDCFGACFSAERGPHIAPGMSWSVLADISQKSSCDLLFTEDSEGNRVIKH